MSSEEPPRPDEAEEPDEADEAGGTDDDEAPIPESDVAGTAEWATALGPEDEAAIIFDGDKVGSGRIDAGLASSLLQSISGFTKALTGIAPDFSGLSAPASTALHFSAGYGEAFRLTTEGGVTTSLRDAFERLVRLIELSPDDEALLAEAREIPAKAASHYVRLLEAVADRNLEARVVVKERRGAAVLAPRSASAARAVLERQAPDRHETREVVGYLYEANAKKRGFELEPEGGGRRFAGTYDPDLENLIGAAWNKVVKVSLRLTWSRLERTHSEKMTKVELVAILDTLGAEPPTPDAPL